MKVALFDMDGTLTKPRQKMGMMIPYAIANLQKSGFRVGIVTGSDMNYVKEQCQSLFDFSPADHTQIDFYPCNGTKHYTLLDEETEHYSHSIKEKLGSRTYNELIYTLCEIQSHFRYNSWCHDIPLSGNFIDCRGSMINYCPIGRNAGKKEREVWVSLDKQFNIRNNILEKYFPENGRWSDLSINLGGETSFDITPEGWDKTFVLKNFKDSDEIWFVGDRCTGTGNDRTLYEAINNIREGHAMQTSSPEETIAIIENKILELKS